MKHPDKPTIALSLLAIVLTLPPTIASAAEDAPSHVNLRAEIWQVPQVTALGVLDQARGKADAIDVALDLRTRAAGGETGIALLAVPSITARSGQRAKASSGENRYISGYKVDTKTEQEVAVSGICLSGTSFEVDPVIGADGITIDLSLALDHALEEPVLTETTIAGPVSGKELTIQSAQENRANLTTSTTILSGQTRLLGSIPTNNTDTLLIVFIYAEIVSAAP